MPSKKQSKASSRDFTAKWLILDSAPLLEAPLSSLRGLATHYLVVPDVLATEMRSKNVRTIVEDAKMHLPADTPEEGKEPDEMTRTKDGFEMREPSAEAIARITAFARKTGDIAVLSTADIRVLALCLTLELEENGSWRVRDYPGQVLTGPPKQESVAGESKEGDGKGKESAQEQETTSGLEKDIESLSMGDAAVSDDEAAAAEDVQPVASTSTLPPPVPSASSTTAGSPSSPPAAPAPAPALAPAPTSAADVPSASTSTLAAASTSIPSEETDVARSEQPAQLEGSLDEDADAADSDAESDASGGSWITPDNVLEHKVRDLGLFSAPEASSSTSAATPAPAPRPRTILKAALLTGDFAMQNVGLQMGLNVLGSGGKRVKEVRTWVLRCHACFKLCKNPDKRFCPSCGGATLLRTSITYVPATPQNPQGYILHLKSNYNYRLRGTQYSLPNPKMGRASGAHSEIVVREDQKEWIKGVRSAEIKKEKEQRALQRQMLDEEEKRKAGLLPNSSTTAAWFADTGSLEAQMMGIGGGKGGIENPKGRKRGGKNGAGGEIRVDKSGLPIIGMGRRNVNEARRRK